MLNTQRSTLPPAFACRFRPTQRPSYKATHGSFNHSLCNVELPQYIGVISRATGTRGLVKIWLEDIGMMQLHLYQKQASNGVRKITTGGRDRGKRQKTIGIDSTPRAEHKLVWGSTSIWGELDQGERKRRPEHLERERGEEEQLGRD